MISQRTAAPVLMVAMAFCLVAEADEPVDFRRDIRPILTQSCFTCHGPDEGSRQTELRLDLPEGILAETGSGLAAVQPGDPDASELWQRLTDEDEWMRMPPPDIGKPLSDDQLDKIRRWIDQGAEYPGHWAFEPPARPEVPAVAGSSWAEAAIDRFVLAKLERLQVEPSPRADPVTLLRRLCFDLIGVPPSRQLVDRFAAEPSPQAYERLVDQLLASPQFGERWGEHWLDLARYADSNGYLGDSLRPHAFVYRDWVIDAINQDMPLDQFTVEQLAGDLLPEPTVSQRVATGFHRNVMKNTEAGADREEDRVNRTVNYVSTTGTVWLGLTLGCVECHTHKYDPISHHEFYRLYAFFNNTEDHDLKLPDVDTSARGGDGDDDKKAAVKAQTMVEKKKDRRASHVHLRGDFRNPGDPVQPGTPEVLHPLRSRGDVPDRLDLARWLVEPDNPLTARVLVNQIWQQLFGRGLVHTADNFGTTGELPSHPELLDHLALQLQQQGWSRKRLIRSIVTSATYQQTSAVRAELQQRDPYNTWLARQSRFRLEAEPIRDAALAVAELLNTRVGGPSIRPPLDPRVTKYSRNKDWPVSAGAEKYRRGLYVLFRRNTPYTTLITFDAPDTSQACAMRERGNSPLQALTLLNDPVFHESAQHFGARLMRIGGSEPAGWIAEAFRIALARSPGDDEVERLVALYHEQRALLSTEPPEQLEQLVGAPRQPHAELLEQATRVAVARSLMNTNEFITRE